MIAWIFWLEFWAVFWRVEPQRTATLYRLDDYRPKPTTPNDRRAA